VVEKSGVRGPYVVFTKGVSQPAFHGEFQPEFQPEFHGEFGFQYGLP
jgi:hypothetical protein